MASKMSKNRWVKISQIHSFFTWNANFYLDTNQILQERNYIIIPSHEHKGFYIPKLNFDIGYTYATMNARNEELNSGDYTVILECFPLRDQPGIITMLNNEVDGNVQYQWIQSCFVLQCTFIFTEQIFFDA